MRQTVAVTGANGYVGGLVLSALAPEFNVVSLVRIPKAEGEHKWHFDMSEDEMTEILQRASVTIIVHVAWDMATSSIDLLRSSCVAGTQRLLTAARTAGVQRFIFISTISAFEGVRSAYGKSKLEAESLMFAHGALVLRLGLVYGNTNKGVFGGLVALATRMPIVPSIQDKVLNQYLLHERSFSSAILRAARGEFSTERRALTLAHPRAICLTDLLRNIADARQRKVLFVPIPWVILYSVLRLAELARVPVSFRSDSLVSLVYQNPAPNFAPLADHKIDMLPLLLEKSSRKM